MYECRVSVVLITSVISIITYALHTLCLTADLCRLKLYAIMKLQQQ